MANTSSPPKKFDKDTMIAEARRALSIDTTSVEDRRAAMRYLLDNGALKQQELFTEIAKMFGTPWTFDLSKVTTLFCVEMPPWLKVDAYVKSTMDGSLFRVVRINSAFVTLSEPLATFDNASKTWRLKSSDILKIHQTKEPFFWSENQAIHFAPVENPEFLPASFAEMVRQNERVEYPASVSLGLGGGFYISSADVFRVRSNG